MEAQLISPKEEQKLKILCDFLLCGSNNEFADYKRFKTCFEYLFSKDEKWLENVYDYLVGVFKGTNEKRKYLSYTRLYQAYLDYKIQKNGQNVNNDISLFFEKLMNSIIKTPDENNIISLKYEENKEKSKEEKKEKEYKFTSREYQDQIYFISRLVVLCNKSLNIEGIKLYYNSNKNYKVKLYKEQELYQALNLELKRIENEYINKNNNNEIIDSITHIFGTFDKTINNFKKYCTFIGFKFSSGKVYYFGRPKGDSFLFGSFGKKVQYLNLNADDNGMTKLEAFYSGNEIVNKYMEFKQNEIDKIFNDEKDLIEKDDNNSDLLRKIEILNSRKNNQNKNQIFAYVIEQKPENEEKEPITTIKKKNINKHYMLNPNPFLNLYNNDIIIPNPFFPKEVERKKEEFKHLRISVKLDEIRNNLKISNYNDIFAKKLSKSLTLNEKRA
jgi:hypothetical protein